MAAAMLIQYVALRRDLLSTLGWPTGAVIAQACHASVAVIQMYKDDQLVKDYLSNLDNMHKVVLEVKNEEELKQLSAALQEGGVCHKLWVEQPENYPTCLATKPYSKSDIQRYFKKFKLFS